MPVVYQETFDNPFAAELQMLRGSWPWLLVLGLLLVLLGTLAISASFITGLALTITFSILLLVSSGVELVSAFVTRRFRGFFVHLLSGVLYLIVGLLMLEHPFEALAGLTLIIAVAFTAKGLVRILVALALQFDGWFWVLLNGLIALTLGIMIWRRWPGDSNFVLGLFFGIELIFNGWSWVMLALGARKIPAAPTGQAAGVS